MGDVAGKGLAGASMVGRLRSALRAYALEGHEGGRVVERLNRLLWTEAEESQMATMLYVGRRPGREHGPMGERRAPAAARDVARRGELPRGPARPCRSACCRSPHTRR